MDISKSKYDRTVDPFSPLHFALRQKPEGLGEVLNNPFYYEPHPLCVEAARMVIADIQKHPEWKEEVENGKMFGVLIVEGGTNTTLAIPSGKFSSHNSQFSILKAYSGQILGRSDWEGYVPPVFDYQQPDGYFKTHETEIVEINKEIERLSQSPELSCARETLYNIEQEKPIAVSPSKESDFANREDWIRRRQFEKAEFHRAKLRWKTKVEEARANLQSIQDKITALKQERKQRSDALQHWLFEHFEMLNARGESKNLIDIFHEWAERTGSKCVIPPSGSGECCAPKLLQYAYKHHLKPVAIAEFSIKRSAPEHQLERKDSTLTTDSQHSTLNSQLNWHQACQSRCKPILDWMLQGLDVEPNPLEQQEERTTVPILYEDDKIIIIDKPTGMLSVPGKSNRKSALDILRQMRPDIPDLMMAHRLDMQTSGILVATKDLKTYKELQKLFLDHTKIRKTYYALLEGALNSTQTNDSTQTTDSTLSSELCSPEHPRSARTLHSQLIILPLTADYLNRPRQKVDKENGKEAITEYEIVGERNGHTLVRLTPITGRTHQLRVHCAHPEGLGVPILGDDLYGHHADRLYLHAQKIQIGDLVVESPFPF